jgi:hypothetical protein
MPSFEGSDPLINTENGVSIFVKGSKKSVVNFGCIYSIVREELDDYALSDFGVHRLIDVFSRPRGRNAFF